MCMSIMNILLYAIWLRSSTSTCHEFCTLLCIFLSLFALFQHFNLKKKSSSSQINRNQQAKKLKIRLCMKSVSGWKCEFLSRGKVTGLQNKVSSHTTWVVINVRRFRFNITGNCFSENCVNWIGVNISFTMEYH